MATKPDIFTDQYRRQEADAAVLLRSSPLPRVLFTELTVRQLADRGLVISPARMNPVWQDQLSGGSVVPIVHVTDWLVQETAGNVDRQAPAAWLPSLVSRVDNLRSVADEEDMPFSDASATAALGFARKYGRARRPSAFLIGNGNIRLLWLNEDQEQIGLQFREDKDVQIVLFEQSGDRLDPITTHKRAEDVIPFLERNRLTRLL